MKAKPNAPVLCVNSQDKIIGCYPPCGLIPMKRFSSLFSPVCFISNSKEDCYYIFRGLFCKYFCHLYTISSHPQSILSLCKLFEDLLHTYEPEVYYHMN